MKMRDEKIRTGISISKDLLRECDAYLSKSDYENHSELIESTLKFFFATRDISGKSEILSRNLQRALRKQVMMASRNYQKVCSVMLWK